MIGYNMEEVRDLDIIIVFEFVSLGFSYIFIFKNWFGGRGLDIRGGLL